MLLVLLCDAVAQGIIQPLCGTSGHAGPEKKQLQVQVDKTKKNGKKGMEKSGSSQALSLEAAVVQDIKKALQVIHWKYWKIYNLYLLLHKNITH